MRKRNLFERFLVFESNCVFGVVLGFLALCEISLLSFRAFFLDFLIIDLVFFSTLEMNNALVRKFKIFLSSRHSEGPLGF